MQGHFKYFFSFILLPTGSCGGPVSQLWGSDTQQDPDQLPPGAGPQQGGGSQDPVPSLGPHEETNTLLLHVKVTRLMTQHVMFHQQVSQTPPPHTHTREITTYHVNAHNDPNLLEDMIIETLTQATHDFPQISVAHPVAADPAVRSWFCSACGSVYATCCTHHMA